MDSLFLYAKFTFSFMKGSVKTTMFGQIITVIMCSMAWLALSITK